MLPSAYRSLVVKVLQRSEEVQALGSAQFALLQGGGGQRVQDLLQQVHLARVGGVQLQLQRVGVIAVLGGESVFAETEVLVGLDSVGTRFITYAHIDER